MCDCRFDNGHVIRPGFYRVKIWNGVATVRPFLRIGGLVSIRHGLARRYRESNVVTVAGFQNQWRGISRARALLRLVAAAAMLLIAQVADRPAEAAEFSPGISQLYTSVSIYPPTAKSMTVCYGFVCRRRESLDFTSGDRAALTRIMAGGRASAAAERKAVQKAVVWFDRRMGPILGTSRRVARADFRAGDDKHNFDCWDTTRNTTSLLLVLQDWKLLKFHTVGNPHYRGNTLVLQTPHNTAVLVERATGVEWVVDMWPRGYAQLPDVMTVERWVKEN